MLTFLFCYTCSHFYSATHIHIFILSHIHIFILLHIFTFLMLHMFTFLLLLGMSNRLKPYNRLLGQVSDRVPGYSVDNLFCSV